MSDPFLAEIRMFGGNFAPFQWALCNGAIMPISQNTALFSLLGTNFGGNGTSTFGLPNLQDNVPLGAGNGAGLSQYVVGEQVGQTTVTLTTPEMPQHSHQVSGNPNVADLKTPTAGTAFARSAQGNAYAPDTGNAFDPMDATAFSAFTGGSGPHNNLQPYLAVTFIIALQGLFPQRQ
jgi:microcystin-dependent protein